MRSRVLLALLLALLVAGAAVMAVRAAGPQQRAGAEPRPLSSLAPPGATAGELARLACARLSLAAQGIRAQAAAEPVRRELADARVLAAQAVRQDGRFAALSGGLAALDDAVTRDDGRAAGLALRVALAECAAVAPAG